MKLSTKGKYGLRALVDVAVNCGKEPVSIQSIGDRQNISVSYLEQLMAKLKKAGFVTSTRGAQGGYRLAKPAQEISVGDVLRALEGNLEAIDCGGNAPGKSCQGADLCVTRYIWKEINDKINETVDSIMLDRLVEESRRKQEEFQKQKELK